MKSVQTISVYVRMTDYARHAELVSASDHLDPETSSG